MPKRNSSALNTSLCNRAPLHNVNTVTTRVCVVGSVNMDTVFDVKALPRPGETVLAFSVHSSPGGKGANQAVAAARSGALVHFVGAVGDDEAATRLREHLSANSVNTDGLVTLPGRSGTAVVLVDTVGENAIVVAPGANGRLALDSAFIQALLAETDVLLLQLEIPATTALAAARAARSAGATVILNASPADADPTQLAVLAQLIDVVVVNEAEAEQWIWPVRHLVITRGAAGASYSGDGEQFAVAAPAVDVVDAAGAGDVFAGVLAADWLAGRDYGLRRACAAGALATLVAGAGDCAPLSEAIDDAVAAG